MKNIWNWIVNLFNGNNYVQDTESNNTPTEETEEELKEKLEKEKYRLAEKARKQKEEEEEEMARRKAINTAYEACNQKFIVLSGVVSGKRFRGDRNEVEGLTLYGEDIITTYGDGYTMISPKIEFLSFMFHHGWEMTSFTAYESNDYICYSLIFMKN